MCEHPAATALDTEGNSVCVDVGVGGVGGVGVVCAVYVCGVFMV